MTKTAKQSGQGVAAMGGAAAAITRATNEANRRVQLPMAMISRLLLDPV